MRKSKIALIVMVLFWVLGSDHSSATWMLEGQAWHSPYQEGGVYLSQVSVKLEPHTDIEFTASLPVQYSRGPDVQNLQCLYPHFSLSYMPSFDSTHSAVLAAVYHLKPHQLSLQGGLTMLYDPLAINFALSLHEKKFSLEGHLVFAVNERWALGAHLHYAKNSLLTYEIYHTSRKGKQRQISYSRYLDGSMQCLGFKFTL